MRHQRSDRTHLRVETLPRRDVLLLRRLRLHHQSSIINLHCSLFIVHCCFVDNHVCFVDGLVEPEFEGDIEPRAKSLRRHRRLILNWFRAKATISAGVVEGFNGRARLPTRKAFGFRTPEGIEIALFYGLGRLPEPRFIHRFRPESSKSGSQKIVKKMLAVPRAFLYPKLRGWRIAVPEFGEAHRGGLP